MRRLLLVLVVTLGVAGWPAQSAPVPPPPPVPMGFLAAEGADFQALRAAGAVAVKLVAKWPDIEARQGAMVWETLDDAVDAARAAGLRVILVLSYIPKWASSATGADLLDPGIYERQPPKRIEDWEAYVTTAVTRYRDRVKDWQVWTARSLPLFRGTTREYSALLRSARVIIKATDPSARIVLSTPYGVDLPDLRGLLTDFADSFDIVSLSPRGVAPDALLRPLGVIRERVLPRTSQSLWIEWDPHSYGLRASWPGQLLKLQAMARAAGVDLIFWTADGTAITRLVLDTLAAQIGRRPYAGYVTRQRAVLLVFGGTDPAAVAWSGAGETMLAVEGSQLTARGATGDPRLVAVDGERRSVTLGTDPLLLNGIGSALLDEARRVPPGGLPVIPGATDYSQAQDVSASLGRTNVERGLYNSPYREGRNEAREVVVLDGVEAIRANAAQERVFLHFDVDDSFLFFVDGRTAVDVIVEVRGASAPQQLGFNLLYDSMSGYRFTPWRWVDVAPGWVSYTFHFTDAAFADTWGWDFALNAAGNRTEDLTVRRVMVRKATP